MKENVANYTIKAAIFLFLISNLLASQMVSSLYFKIIKNDKKSTVDFLERMKTSPDFEKLLVINENIYGKNVADEVFRRENDKKKLINNLEQILTLNPRERDVLYNLYLAYRDQGNNFRAENYLRRAQAIDPKIKN